MDSISQGLLRAKCRENGLRITPQRTAIYEELSRSGKHPSAEQLNARVKARFPNISLDTVNRTLLTFARMGLAEIVEGFGNARRYDPNLKSHHHVHCIKCGAITDFLNSDYDALKIPADIRRRFEIISKKVVLNGICPKCRGKRDKKNNHRKEN